MENIVLLFIALSVSLGIGGWAIHLYTLIRSAFADEKWTVKVLFNYYHEAIAELIVFTTLIMFMLITLILIFL